MRALPAILSAFLAAALLRPGLAFSQAIHVPPPPMILTQPASQIVPAGAILSMSVAFDTALPPVTSGKLQLWLKADAGVVADARGRVHLWHDQSENQNDASQPCAAMEPLLAFPPPLAGRPALRFDGLLVASKTGRGVERISFGTYLQSDGQVDIPGAMTSFCVHRVAAPSAPEHVLWAVGQPNIWGEMRLDMTRDDVSHFETWSYDADTGFKTKAGGFRIRADRMPAGLNSVEIIDTSAEGAVEFTRTLTGTKAPLPGYFVGGLDPAETFGRNFDGDIAEILIYQGALDDVDLRAVNDYLQDKYLPATRLEGASLQWLFNGVNIAGATNVTLVLTNVRAAMSGAYSIMVSNAAGAAQSSNALVSVKNP